MKKAISFLVFFCSLAAFLFAQNALTPDQIRRYANELGVPYEALQQFVNSYRVQTKLTNANASRARLLTIQELNTMRGTDALIVGAYYIVQARYYTQNDKTVNLDQNDGSTSLFVNADFFVNIPELSNADALITVKADVLGRPRELVLVEIVAR